jgi:hypothetical protein
MASVNLVSLLPNLQFVEVFIVTTGRRSLGDDRPFRYGTKLAGAMSGGADTSMSM